MPKIKVESNGIRALEMMMQRQADEMRDIEQAISSVISNLDIQIASSEGIRYSLNSLKNASEQQFQNLSEMSNHAVRVNNEFSKADKNISKQAKEVQYLLEHAGMIGATSNPSIISSFGFKKLNEFLGIVDNGYSTTEVVVSLIKKYMREKEEPYFVRRNSPFFDQHLLSNDGGLRFLGISPDTLIDKSFLVPSVLGMVAPATGLLYITSGLINGKIPSVLDKSRVPSSSASAGWLGYEVDKDKPKVTAWLGKGSAETQNEAAYAKVNGYIGKTEAKADADFNFMETTKKKEYKNGEWTEKDVTTILNAEAGADASISVLEGDAEAGVGSDMLGLEGKVEGGIGNADAGVEGKFSVGEDGVNAYAKGEAMVSAVEGKAEGTINILGLEITGKASGYVGALGVEGKVGIENNKFVIEGGAAALFGFSAGLEIGLNDEGWDNFVDYVTFWD